MECLLVEQKMVKFTKELLVDNLKIMEKEVRLIDAVQLQTELVMLCCILCLEGL